MRILLVSGSLPPMKCGVGDYTANLANALTRCGGISVAVLTDIAANPVPPEFEFQVLPVSDGWRMRNTRRILKVARSWKPDIIHVQYPSQGYVRSLLPWLLPALFQMIDIPVVQTWHEYYSNSGRRNLLNAMVNGGLIVVRPDYKTKMPGWFRWLIRKKLFKFIPNASAIPKASLSCSERAAVRTALKASSPQLLVYFGFTYPSKRVELLFEVADPTLHHVVLISDLHPEVAYHKGILDVTEREPWVGKVTITGFLAPAEVARILAAADAVVFPFQHGGGLWNTSLHAASLQGTFVLTTSDEKHGYDALRNIYFADPGNISEMRTALLSFAGQRIADTAVDPASEWQVIAETHQSFYHALLSGARPR
jgi:glycosyltransferase involved in cell wall biosynthesis